MPPPRYATTFLMYMPILFGGSNTDAAEKPAVHVEIGSPWLTTEVGTGGGLMLGFSSSVAPAGIFVDNLGCSSLAIERLQSGSFTTAATVTPRLDHRCGRLKVWWANSSALAAQVWRLTPSGTATGAPVGNREIGRVVVPSSIATFSEAAAMTWPEPEIIWPVSVADRAMVAGGINVEGRPRVQYTIRSDAYGGTESVYSTLASIQALRPGQRIFVYENLSSTDTQYAYLLEVAEDPEMQRGHVSIPMSAAVVLREAWT